MPGLQSRFEFGLYPTAIADESPIVGHRASLRVGVLNCRVGDQTSNVVNCQSGQRGFTGPLLPNIARN